MATPWFDPIAYSWIPGSLVGLIGGGIGGPLIGTYAAQGKHRKMVMGFVCAVMTACAALLATGLYAWATAQPYGIWYGFGFPGLLGLIVFGALVPTIRRRYADAERRAHSNPNVASPR